MTVLLHLYCEVSKINIVLRKCVVQNDSGVSGWAMDDKQLQIVPMLVGRAGTLNG